MGWLWLLVFGLGNLTIVGLWLYMFGLRETPAPQSRPLSRDGRQTLRLLQELTAEVAERAEENAERLEAVAQELSGLPANGSPESLTLLKRRSIEQREFANWLRRSGETLQKYNSQLGVRPANGNGKSPADSARGASAAAESREPQVPTNFDFGIGADLHDALPGADDSRRREDREPTSFTLSVLPLDAGFRPDGEPIVAVAREVSTGGMSFAHTSPMKSPYVAIRITLGDDHDNFLVMDCRHSSSAGPMFITGGAFLHRLEDGPVRRILTDFAGSSETADGREYVGRAADLAVW